MASLSWRAHCRCVMRPKARLPLDSADPQPRVGLLPLGSAADFQALRCGRHPSRVVGSVRGETGDYKLHNARTNETQERGREQGPNPRKHIGTDLALPNLAPGIISEVLCAAPSHCHRLMPLVPNMDLLREPLCGPVAQLIGVFKDRSSQSQQCYGVCGGDDFSLLPVLVIAHWYTNTPPKQRG